MPMKYNTRKFKYVSNEISYSLHKGNFSIIMGLFVNRITYFRDNRPISQRY